MRNISKPYKNESVRKQFFKVSSSPTCNTVPIYCPHNCLLELAQTLPTADQCYSEAQRLLGC